MPTAMIVEGRTKPRRIQNSLTAFLVTHPAATFVVDPGVCIDVATRAVAQLPAALRAAVRPSEDVVPTVSALSERGYTQADIDFALPTHAHWDHVCGLLDLPSLPVYLHRPELHWIAAGSVAPVGGVRDSLADRPITDYELDGPPVLTFRRSHDLFGDGSVVLVDLSGHTPGSVGVLLHTSAGHVLLAGDAVWHGYQVDDIRQKASYPGALADEDRDEAFRSVHRLHAIKDRVTVVPTHDPLAAMQLGPIVKARV